MNFQEIPFAESQKTFPNYWSFCILLPLIGASKDFGLQKIMFAKLKWIYVLTLKCITCQDGQTSLAVFAVWSLRCVWPFRDVMHWRDETQL